MSVTPEEVGTIAPSESTPPPPIAEVRAPLFDRELSWIEFNRRVLGEAQNPDVPLLERLKFLSIAAHNLDEFLMIRVGEVRDLITAQAVPTAQQVEKLEAIRKRVRHLLDGMYGCLTDEVLPALKREGIRIDRVADLGKRDRAAVQEYFNSDLEPILTPLAIDPGHPFPFLANRALNLALQLESGRGERYLVVVKIPELSPRVVFYGEKGRFVLLEDVITSHIEQFFPGLKIRKSVVFRVIRNSDISIKEEEVQDLLKSVESELRRRERREVVWVEVEAGSDERILSMILAKTGAAREDVYTAPGPLKLDELMMLYEVEGNARLKDPPFNPRIPAQLATSEDIFSIIRKGDVLLHRPYDSFAAVIDFVQSAAEDPDVVAIKQTLYRTDPDSPAIEALRRAAERGKQVTAVVELQARFDEQKNITWARHLEEAGVQVVYGLIGMKTHCKVCLVVRREGTALRRYVHLSTGNYNATTARLYTDLDLMTADKKITADAAQLLNLLTGFSVAGVQEMLDQKEPALTWRELVVAPMDYHRWALSMIDRETRNAREGKPARIVAKMNAVVDAAVITALYAASSAGVKIDLMVRGVCCLVPGVPSVSENIRVTSVIDRFLEHSRVFRFENAGAPEIWISSGDWMPRNFIRRIEVTIPVRSETIKRRIEEQILPISLADNVKGWYLDAEGKYHRREPDGKAVRSQEAFIALARSEAVAIGPYEEILHRAGSFRRKAKKKKK
ncbi:MAG TPA: polyphosphate kinase 1 [Thermoanaerobaculia bacterium]|jgi:polyphosphate kinase